MKSILLGLAWFGLGLVVLALTAIDLTSLLQSEYRDALDARLAATHVLAAAAGVLALIAGVAFVRQSPRWNRFVAAIAIAFLVYAVAYLLFGGEGHWLFRFAAPTATITICAVSLLAVRGVARG